MSCLNTLSGATQRRVLTCKGKPQPYVPRYFVKTKLKRVWKPILLERNTMDDVIEWQSEKRLKMAYRKAKSDYEDGVRFKVPLRIKIFTKEEKSERTLDPDLDYHLSTEYFIKLFQSMEGDEKDSRVILPPDIIYRLLLSTYFGKPNEHRIVEELNKQIGYPAILKGYSPKQMGAIIKELWDSVGGDGEAIFVGLDCSRFDAHFNESAATYVYDFLANMYPLDPEARRLLNLLFKVKLVGTTKEGFFTVRPKNHTLLSGVPITSIAAIIVVAGVLFDETGGAPLVKFIDMGDDFGLIMHRSCYDIVDSVLNAFREIGQEVVRESYSIVIEGIRFCQMMPLEVSPGEWIMVRDPQGLGKDFIKIKSDKDISRRDWAYSVAQCGLAWMGKTPIAAAHYRIFESLGKGGKYKPRSIVGGLGYYSRPSEFVGSGTVETCARLSFHRGTGIDPETQIAIETLLDYTTAKCA